MQQVSQQTLKKKQPCIGIKLWRLGTGEINGMLNLDDPLNIFLAIVSIAAGIFFLGIQYEICIEMPDQWFAGFSSGMVLAGCLAVLYSRRDER